MRNIGGSVRRVGNIVYALAIELGWFIKVLRLDLAFHQVIGEKRGDYDFLIFAMLSQVFLFLGKPDLTFLSRV